MFKKLTFPSTSYIIKVVRKNDDKYVQESLLNVHFGLVLLQPMLRFSWVDRPHRKPNISIRSQRAGNRTEQRSIGQLRSEQLWRIEEWMNDRLDSVSYKTLTKLFLKNSVRFKMPTNETDGQLAIRISVTTTVRYIKKKLKIKNAEYISCSWCRPEFRMFPVRHK